MQKADFGPMLEINEINSVVIKILLDNVVFFFFFFLMLGCLLIRGLLCMVDNRRFG